MAPLSCHITGLKDAHPHINATYKVVPLKDKTFGVEVSVPGASPTTVSSFATKADAERWIENHKNEVAKGSIQRRSYNRRR